MLFIGVIFLILIGIIIFIYSGLRLTEGITNDTTYILYWGAYLFVGMTVAMIIVLIYLWGDLQGKVGPPGPRGPPGDTGEDGIPGECDDSHTALGIMYTIREAIQERVLSVNKEAKVITDDGKLVNIFLEMRLQQMATSNQLGVILETGKSVADITAYLKGIWLTWVDGILSLPKGQEFFTTADAQADISPEITDYFTKEIDKYDVWYWGTTPVFRPLKAEVCRRSAVYNPATGSATPNAYLPQPDRPELEFMEIEYSDRDISKLTIMYDTNGMPATNPDRAKRWESVTDTPTGYVSQPLFCIPKSVTKGKQTFYPVCQVVVESNPKYMTNTKKKTILVSGDIIIPTTLEQVWSGKVTDKKGAIKAEGIFYKVSTQVPGYICLGDYFLNKGALISAGNTAQIPTTTDALKYLGYDLATGKILSAYRGIVAVPSKCIEKLERMPVPAWKYQMVDTSPNHVAVFESENASEGYYSLRIGQYGATVDETKQGEPHYQITDKCTQTFDDVPVKELEAAFNDLGIGWFGQPAKQDQKYSIFAYLGIMPEGIITHRSSGRKYYIKHYGGNDANKYIIVKWSSEEGDFVQSLKAISDSAVIIEPRISPSDKAQQWFIERDSGSRQYFRLKSVMFPNKYLSLDYNIGLGWNKYANPEVSLSGEDKSLLPLRPKGVSVSHTDVLANLVGAKGSISAANKTLFSNMPAYGVNYDIVEKAENKNTRGMSFNQQRDEQEKIGPQTDFKYIMSGTNIIPVNDRDSSVPDNKVVFS